MTVDRSTRFRARRGRSLLAAISLITGLAVAMAPAAQADRTVTVTAVTYSDPVLGAPVTVSGSVGPADTHVDTPSRCPAGAALTSVVGDIASGTPGWLTGIEPTCTAILGGDAVHLGSASATMPLRGFRGAWNPGTTACPTGSVAVGIGGNAGGLAENVQLFCRALGTDGALGPDLQTADLSGPGVNGAYNGPILCPAGAVITSVTGRLGQDITYIRIACSSLGFTTTSVTPQPDNTSWPHATLIGAPDDLPNQQLATSGQQLWYKFPVQPGSQVHVGVSGLTNNLDLAVFKDIGQAFDRLTTTQDLTHVSAEFAGDAFAPSVFSPSVFSPSVFSPSVFSPSVFSPSVFSPSVFSPSVFSPSVFSPSVFSPSVFSPSVFSPSVFSPSVFSPSVFSGGTPSQASLADAFSSAQVRSLVGVSASDGTAAEAVDTETWGNTGYYYVRVTGRNSATSPFEVTTDESGGPCGTPLDAHAADTTIADTNGATPQTVILTDSTRMAVTPALTAAIGSFASQVGGAIVDVGQSPKVAALNAQADRLTACPYAKNLVAQSIRDIVNSYRSPSLTYVVIVGDDSIIPFFRYADTAGLGPENNYFPPMSDSSASQASLRNNTVLSQDAYGSAVDVSIKGATLPVPDLAVGRLVESPAEITATLDRYASTPVITPTSTLATGYDFLADAAKAVAADFAAGDPAGRNDTLITDQGVPTSATTPVGGTPDPSHSWTATDLSNALLGRRHDVVFLAGHFSANSALAADYSTSLLTTQLAASTTDFSNSLVFSAGCHSGYNIVDRDGVPGYTVGLDWAQAFAQKGATLVAGTGYQYGDTDFVAYSEKLYGMLAHDLRQGAAGTAVAVGTALVQAKQDYLSGLTAVGGIDQKSLLEATLFGLPMQGVDFAGRLPTPSPQSGIAPTPVDTGPGATLGLQSAGLSVPLSLTPHTVPLNDGAVSASYLSGKDGVTNAPGAPTLPLQSVDVGVDDTVLRGVGLRSGTYTDTGGITPLTGAATTEQSAAHTAFTSAAFYPSRVAVPNYFGALAGGATTLNLTPAQYRSDSGPTTTTQRAYSALGLQLFYSSNIQTYTDPATGASNTPALAAAPSISGVTAQASPDGSTVHVSTHVVGDPSAGIQQVWVTYTGTDGSVLHGAWQSVDLTQDHSDSTLWAGDITVPDSLAGNVRFLVQAVNGVGEVGVDDNVGDYYSAEVTPGALPAIGATSLALDASQATGGTLGGSLPVGATLTDGLGLPLAGRTIVFSLGASGVAATTGLNGRASANLPLTSSGAATLVAGWAGDATDAASSSVPLAVTIARRPTSLTVSRTTTGAFAATLADAAGGLPAQTVTLVATSVGGATLLSTPASTGGDGVARFAADAAPGGTASVRAWFGDPATPGPAGTATDQTSTSYLPTRSGSLGAATIALDTTNPDHGLVGRSVTIGARVTAAGAAVSDAPVTLTVGTATFAATTDSTGHASAVVPLLAAGPLPVSATYAGDAATLPAASAVSTLVVTKQGTAVTLVRTSTGSFESSLANGDGAALGALPVTLVATAAAGTVLAATTAATDAAGIARFPAGAAPSGTGSLQAWFGSATTPGASGPTDRSSTTYTAATSSALHPATIALVESPAATSGFGTPVTFRVTVSGQSGASTAPTGPVAYTVDGTPVATSPLSSTGSSALPTSALLPGRHTVTASYGGDSAFLPNAASVIHSITCGRTITGAVKGNLVASGTSYCLLNATVTGSVAATNGVPVAIVNSTVGLAVVAGGAGQTMVCGSVVGLGVAIDRATGLVVVGDAGHSRCAPNRIGGLLALTNDTHGVEAIGNTVPVVATKNISGPGPYPGDLTTVSGNHR